GVEHDPDRLASFHLEHTCGELVTARRSGPADVAEFVALTVVAETFKLAALTALPLAPPFHFDLAASNQVEGLLPRLLQIGEHANGLREVDQRPALDESPLALILHKQTPDPFISALSGKNGVLRFGDLFRQDDERYGGRRVSECGVRFVGRRASDGDRSGILHVNGDVALRSERGRVFPT